VSKYKEERWGPAHSDIEVQFYLPSGYSWEQGQLKTSSLMGTVNALSANPVSAKNVTELRRL